MDPRELARIQPAYTEALALSGPDRERFLADRFSGEPELLAEVSELLRCSEEAQGFLAAPLIPRFFESGFSGHEPARVGPYELLRELGRGGAASVYLARRADDLYEKRVAVKILNRFSHSREIFLRFQREIESLARLDHPYIVRLLDAGLSGEAVAYIVTELVEGERLDRFAAGRPLAARLQLFCKVCEGVSAAHRSLVVHRDLKPSNILVTPDGSPKLLDFGIALLLDRDARLTATGVDRMTLHYASPEQLRGEKAITTASDVYALGLLLYELVSGTSAHRAGSGASPEPLDLHDGPRELRAVVRKATEYDPARRYESADRLREDVTRFLDGSPVLAHDDGALYRLRKFARRHWMPISAACLAVAALLALSVVSLRSSRESQRQLQRMKQLLSSALNDSAIDRSGRTSIHALRLVRETQLQYLNSLAPEYPGDSQLAHLRFEALRGLGLIAGLPSTLNLGESAKAREYLAAAAQAGEEFRSRFRDPAIGYDLAIVYIELGSVLLEMDHRADALAAFDRSDALSASSGGSGKRSALEVLAQKSRILDLEGRLADALAIRRRVADARRALFEKNPEEYRWEYAGSLCSYGELLREAGLLAESRAAYTSALPMIEDMVARQPHAHDFDWHAARENEEFGRVLLALGDDTEADTRFRRAIALYRRIRVEEPDAMSNQRALAVCLSLFGEHLAKRGDRARALPMLREALALSTDAAVADSASARAQTELAAIRARLASAL